MHLVTIEQLERARHRVGGENDGALALERRRNDLTVFLVVIYHQHAHALERRHRGLRLARRRRRYGLIVSIAGGDRGGRQPHGEYGAASLAVVFGADGAAMRL